jgi:hypothetical protein
MIKIGNRPVLQPGTSMTEWRLRKQHSLHLRQCSGPKVCREFSRNEDGGHSSLESQACFCHAFAQRRPFLWVLRAQGRLQICAYVLLMSVVILQVHGHTVEGQLLLCMLSAIGFLRTRDPLYSIKLWMNMLWRFVSTSSRGPRAVQLASSCPAE